MSQTSAGLKSARFGMTTAAELPMERWRNYSLGLATLPGADPPPETGRRGLGTLPQLILEAVERGGDDVAVMEVRPDGADRIHPQLVNPVDIVERQLWRVGAE